MLIRTVYAVANTTPAGLHTFRSDEAKAEITLRAGARTRWSGAKSPPVRYSDDCRGS
jgi:hypothetical protein